MKTQIKQHTYPTYQDFYFAARAYGYRDAMRETPSEWYFIKDGVKHVWVKPRHTPEEIAEFDRTTDASGNSYSDAEKGSVLIK